MNLDFFTAKSIASRADISDLESYESEVLEYQARDYTYIPMPQDGKYYHVNDEELREIASAQYLHPDTTMMEAFRKLEEYPFLLFDAFRDFERVDGEFVDAGINEYDFPDGPVNPEEIVAEPDRFREHYADDATTRRLIDIIMDRNEDRYRILTLADVNKRRARELFYRVLSEFEVQLATLVEQEYPDSETLFSEAKPEAIGRWQKSKLDDLVVHISEHMYLTTLMKIVGKSESLRSRLGYSSRNQFDDDLGGLIELRNRIMHPTQTLVHDVEDLTEAVDRVTRAMDALEKLDGEEIQPNLPESVSH